MDGTSKGEEQASMTLITELPGIGLALASKKYQVYMVEHSVPPTTFPKDELFYGLPSTVEFNRIVANVITSLSTSYFKRVEQEQEQTSENTIEKWTRYLNYVENKALVSDCFWYAICKFFHKDKYVHSEEELRKRMSKNYIGLMLSIEDQSQNKTFFQEYFNTLAQSVFYSFFYAFPKSRARFNESLKYELVALCSRLFTGIEISNKKFYYDKWTLDLGTGNILARRNRKNDSVMQPSTPEINSEPKQTNFRTKKRATLAIRYSPIVQLYLKTHKYKTRNYVSEFKMKYTQVEKNDHLKEAKFVQYKQEAKRILEWSQGQREEEEKKKQQLEAEIKAIKRDTLNHHRRLDRRKEEELQRGAHQYANYLASMLNSGITMASLGVVRNNV